MSEPGNTTTSGGAVLFASIMGISVVACICCLGVMCAKRRRQAKEDLQTSIEMANFYASSGQAPRSAMSPPPPGMSQVVPVVPPAPPEDDTDKRAAASSAIKEKRRKSRRDKSIRRDASRGSNMKGRPTRKDRMRQPSKSGRKRSKSRHKKKGRSSDPLPGKQKRLRRHEDDTGDKGLEEVQVAVKEDADVVLDVSAGKDRKKDVANRKDNKKMKKKKSKKKKSKKKKSKKRKIRNDDGVPDGDEIEVARRSSSDSDTENEDGDSSIATVKNKEPDTKEQDNPPPIPKPAEHPSPQRRPGGALLGSLPKRSRELPRDQSAGISIPSSAQATSSSQKDALRRTIISLQVVSAPESSAIGQIVGPVKLHDKFRVASVGVGNCQLKLCVDDSGIKQEHGLITYRGDSLLYANVSGGPTIINGVSINESDPVELKSGSLLKLGSTDLLLTWFTMFENAD